MHILLRVRTRGCFIENKYAIAIEVENKRKQSEAGQNMAMIFKQNTIENIVRKE